METIHVVLATDENYTQHASVMIASLLQNKKSPNPIVFHVLGDELSSSSCSKLAQIVQKHNSTIYVLNINIEQISNMSITIPHISRTTYLRLLIADILSLEIEKALYLDIDIIVREDITELWNINITDYYLAAVKDFYITEHYPNKNPSHRLNLKMPQNESYFNAGVLLINVSKWRKDNIGLKVIEFIENNNHKIKFQDQDGLNAILWGKWLQLSPKWNSIGISLQTYHDWGKNKAALEFIEIIKKPAICHFTGHAKPWKYGYGCIIPYAKEYWKYLKMTPWKDYSCPMPNNLSEWQTIIWIYFKIFIIKSGLASIAAKIWFCKNRR